MLKKMLKKQLKKLPQSVYYNLLTTHDVLQAAAWRRVAPTVTEEAFQKKYQMLFVVGCGRSGTTIFSHCLGKHLDVTELNEPLHLWFATDMRADIVSPFSRLLRGRCRFDRHDVNDQAKARYRAMVDYQVQGDAPVICDKLPLNTFRVDYIQALRPNAKFILLNRSPRAVARSIEQCVKRDGAWWGFNDCKWQAIRRYAESHPELRNLIPYAIDDYYRGLFEWRVSQELARNDLSKLAPGQSLEVDYDNFTNDPGETLAQAFDFADMPIDQAAIDFANMHVAPTGNEDDGQRRSIEDDKLHALILGDEFDQKTERQQPETAFIEPPNADQLIPAGEGAPNVQA